MANASEMHSVIDSSKLPETLRDYQALGLDDKNRLVGQDTEGNTHLIRSISRLALEGFHEAGGIGSASMEDHLQELSEAVANFQEQLEAERTQRTTERADLLNQIEQLQNRLDVNDPLKRNFAIGDEVQTRNAENNLEAGGVVASGVWTQEEGGETVEYVTVAKDGAVTQVKLDDLRQLQTEAAPTNPAENQPPAPEEDDQPQQSRLERMRARFNRQDQEQLGRGRLVGALAVGAVVGGLAVYALEHKFMGHSPSHEARLHIQDQLSQLKAQEVKDHAADIKLSKANHAAEMKAIAANAHTIAVDHTQEITTITTNHQAEMDKLAQLHQEHANMASSLDHSHVGGNYSHHSATVASKPTGATLRYRGDAVQKEVARSLKIKGYLSNLSPAKQAQRIHAATSNTLRLNHLRWSGGGRDVDSHNLPIGFRFRMPNFAQMFKK